MSLELKEISKLKDLHFFVPDYQRGYRWTEKEVLDLLNDINNFSVAKDTPWYCLQPLIVKNDEKNNYYEVIDGQQRLTTIFLILKSKEQNNYFKLSYQNLDNKIFENLDNNNNINAQDLNAEYIKDAYIVIKNFQYKDNFWENLKNNTKFIWYEDNNNISKSIDIFRRINSGKIALEDSERIKALFLNRKNFIGEPTNTIYFHQLKIANEWYEFENKLQDNKFWFFLQNNDKKSNRIEFVFELLQEANQEDEAKKLVFDFYINKYLTEGMSKFIKDEWDEIKNCFYTLEEWYQDYELYNNIGYLQTIERNKNIIKDLYKKYTSSNDIMDKDKFKKYIKDCIKTYISTKLNNEQNTELSDLTNILKKGENDTLIREILLFHNIVTLNKRKEFFRFDLYKNTNWDIEHIASAGGDKIPNNPKDIKEYLETTLNYLQPDNKYNNNFEKDNSLSQKEKDFINTIKTLLNAINKTISEKNDLSERTKDNFDTLFVALNNYYQDIEISVNEEKEEINLLQNLVLLDRTTNRSYQNNIFPIKRKKIIELDKIGMMADDNGVIRYLLPCTRNVFLKYYSENTNNPNKWDKNDMNNYLEDLKETLRNFN